MYHPPNSKNDVIWAKDKNDIEHVPVDKFSPKVIVWGAMSFSGLTELHVVPQGQSVNQEYYCTEILEGNLFPRMQKKPLKGLKI